MTLENLLTLGVAAAIFLAIVLLRLILGGLIRLGLKVAGRAPAVPRPAPRPRSHAMPRGAWVAQVRAALQRGAVRALKGVGAAVAGAGLAVARAGCSIAEAGAAYQAKLATRSGDKPDAPSAGPGAPPPPRGHIDLRDEDPLGMDSIAPRAVGSSR